MEEKVQHVLDKFTKNPPVIFPRRKDGYPDLKNWKGFVNQFNYKNIGDLIAIRKHVSKSCIEGALLDKAVEAKKEEIAKKLFDVLFAEELTVNDAISILDRTQEVILESKLT